MLKVLICVKSIPDLEQMVSEDWKYGDDLSEPNISYVNRVMNYYDENALEILLRFKDICTDSSVEMEIDIITIGDAKSVKILEECYAKGVNSCVLIENESNWNNHSSAVATMLHKFIIKGSYDAVFCGESAAPYDKGQTAFLLSYLLQIPCIINVQELHLDSRGIVAVYDMNGERYQHMLQEPFVGVVGNVSGLRLRLPTLKERLLSIKKNIMKISIKELELNTKELYKSERKSIVRMFAKEIKKDCHYVDLENLPEDIAFLEQIINEG